MRRNRVLFLLLIASALAILVGCAAPAPTATPVPAVVQADPTATPAPDPTATLAPTATTEAEGATCEGDDCAADAEAICDGDDCTAEAEGCADCDGDDCAQGGEGAEAEGQHQGGGGGGPDANAADHHELPDQGGPLSESEIQALNMAIQDEYKALATYLQVMADHGEQRPFSNIARSEMNHISELEELFERYGLEVPESEWEGKIDSVASIQEACEVGVQAEIENAALYEEMFAMVEHEDIIYVFESLQSASQLKHLEAFKRCASR